MFARISYTWELMRASWAVFKRDRYLVLFPLFSGIACLLVMASFVVPLSQVDWSVWKNSMGHMAPQQKIEMWSYLFAFYFVNYFVITFFNAGIIACATCRMAGGEPTFGFGMRAAIGHIHLIAGWALVSATVGVVLKAIESSHKKAGRFIAELLGGRLDHYDLSRGAGAGH